jgi:hypothetical protein
MHKHQVFISSQMRRGALNCERASVREVILKFPTLKPWDWENEGPSGPSTPMDYCLREVERSYAFILVVGGTLTNHTHQEYKKAVETKKNPFVFFKQTSRDQSARDFKKSVKSSRPVFKNMSELKSIVLNSLNEHIYSALENYQPEIATPAPMSEIIEK